MDTINIRLDDFLKYYGLTDWWLTTFAADERRKIVETYQIEEISGEFTEAVFEELIEDIPEELIEDILDGSIEEMADELTEGEMQPPSKSATDLLSGLANGFKNEVGRHIAYKLLQKAEELSEHAAEILERHFMYQTKIEIYYRFRNIDDFALQKAVEGCEQQIAMSDQAAEAFRKKDADLGLPGHVLPMHVGFEQLAIIREKEGRIEEAIGLCEQALKEGWNGTWKRRIDRYEKRRSKLS